MRTKNTFPKIFPVLLCLALVFFLYQCENTLYTKAPAKFGGGRIIFNIDSVVVDAGKNNVSFKVQNEDGLEIPGIWTIINNDSTFFQNEMNPYDASIITKNQYSLTKRNYTDTLKQTLYSYKDTIYGDWYTVILNNGKKICVTVNKNTTGISRKLVVLVESGNSHGGVNVIQKTIE